MSNVWSSTSINIAILELLILISRKIRDFPKMPKMAIKTFQQALNFSFDEISEGWKWLKSKFRAFWIDKIALFENLKWPTGSRKIHPCALELHPFFGYLNTPGVLPQVNFKYHEIMKFYCKSAPPGIEPAIPRIAGESSNHYTIESNHYTIESLL